ncbi:MAG: flagellar biosynthesis repressor FlbT [Thiobacillus sp.]|nr:flagellar biosynthesis repressor FlbT [Thiobacillus sp.]
MALSLTLKPKEKIFIGGAVVQNGQAKAELTILNDVPILRHKEIMHEQEADTPCRRIYLAVQQMYMDGVNRPAYFKLLEELVNDVAQAAPSTVPRLREVGDLVTGGQYYLALKAVKQLINYESELLKNARQCD